MDTIERVAKSLLDTGMIGNLSFPDDYKRLARSAIEAMREPSGLMCDAGNYTFHPPEHVDIAEAYRAMIDAALK